MDWILAHPWQIGVVALAAVVVELWLRQRSLQRAVEIMNIALRVAMGTPEVQKHVREVQLAEERERRKAEGGADDQKRAFGPVSPP